jgi:hypothetical protein
LDDNTSHEVVVDAAFIVEWHDRQVSWSRPLDEHAPQYLTWRVLLLSLGQE